LESQRPLIYRQDRWTDVLDRLKNGADYGIEFPIKKKTDAYVSVLGRRMTIGEASDLSGIDNEFYKKFEGKEVPVEVILARLDYQWMKEKTRMLKQGMR
jgi:hypothetical protein